MDDIQISYKDSKVVDQVIEIIEIFFDKMIVTRGKSHTFVGMDIKFMEDRTTEIKIKQYIKECTEEFGENIVKGSNTPSKHKKIMIGESDSLSNKIMNLFHHIICKLMYTSKRARVDIDLAVSLICTRVSCSTKVDTNYQVQ